MNSNEPLPLVSPSVSGRPQFSDWSTEAAIRDGLKALPVIYACVKKRKDAIASLPWYVEERRGDEWERLPGHPIETLLKEPNAHMSGQDLFERLSQHLDLSGNGLWHKVLVRGMPVELWPLAPDQVRPIPHSTEYLQGYEYTVPGSSVKKTLLPEEVTHFMLCDPGNPYWGMSPLKAAASMVDTSVEAIRWNYLGLQNRSVKDAYYLPSVPMTKEQWANAREQITAQHSGPDGARGVFVVSMPGDIKTTGLTAVEFDFLDSLKHYREEIAGGIYGVPPALIGAMDASSYNNIITLKRMFWEDAVIPDAENLCQAMNRSLVPHWDPESARPGVEAKIRIVYDTSNVPAMQENFTEKVSNAQKLWIMGVPLNMVNQRLKLGFGDIPGGDIPRQPTGTLASVPADGSKSRLVKSVDMTEEQKAAYWKSLDGSRQKWEGRIETEIKRLFASEAEKAVAEYRSTGAVEEIDSKPWTATLEAAYIAVAEAFGQRELDRVSSLAGKSVRPLTVKAFDRFHANVLNFVEKTAAKRVQGITAETRQRVAQTIAAGVAEDMTKDEIADMIKAAYADMKTSRAFTISRTEVGAAYGFGNHEGARQGAAQYGLALEKAWLSSRDDRVRDRHQLMDGEVAAMDARYSNGLKYPGDPDGSAEEVINCRCAEMHSVAGTPE